MIHARPRALATMIANAKLTAEPTAVARIHHPDLGRHGLALNGDRLNIHQPFGRLGETGLHQPRIGGLFDRHERHGADGAFGVGVRQAHLGMHGAGVELCVGLADRRRRRNGPVNQQAGRERDDCHEQQ